MWTNATIATKKVLGIFIANRAELVFSLLFSGIFTLGYMLAVGEASMKKSTLPVFICGFIIFSVLSFIGLLYVRQKSLRIIRRKKVRFLSRYSDNKLWLITSTAVFICYIPVILLVFSVLTIDSWSSIRQVTGEDPLSRAHPLIFTAFSGIFIQTGRFFGSLELGTILFSFAQSAILAVIFGRIIVWMRNEGVGKNGIIAAFIFYAILPINSFAGTIMWKDILFAGFGLVLLVLLREMFIQKDTFFNRRNVLLFILFAFLFCAWRNNGAYAYVLMLVILALVDYKVVIQRKYLASLLAPILLFACYSSITALISKPAVSVEAMSVPLQQIARTVVYEENSLSVTDKAAINEILPYERLDDLYKPHISDPVKGSFKLSVFRNDEAKYLTLWFKLFTEHKQAYVSAFLLNTYGYVYPFKPSPTTTDTVVDNSIQLNAAKGYRDSAHENGKPTATAYRDLIRSIAPVLGNIGFYTCVILGGLYVAIIRKRAELTAIFILLLSLFITTILGPVNGEFRYLYLFVLATPFILASVYTARHLAD